MGCSVGEIYHFRLGLRSNQHSSGPDHGCCEMGGSAIVALCETTTMFQAIEASLNTVSVFVKILVVRDEHLPVPF